MGKQKCRTKTVLAVACSSQDGYLWHWNIRGVSFEWCKLGWLHQRKEGQLRRLLFSKTLEGAVGYTAGWADGHDQGQGKGQEEEG